MKLYFYRAIVYVKKLLTVLTGLYYVLIMKHEEDIIQSQIVKWLQLNNYVFHSVPNEAVGGGKDKRSAIIRMTKLISLGLKKGAPDLVVYLYGGKSVKIEVKSSTGEQSYAQINFESRLKQLQHEYHVVRSLDEVIEIFKDGKRR